MNIGEGMTKKFQGIEYNGKLYVDTPGLSDINMRKDAAKEITKALKIGGIYQLVFVITLIAGRVQPDDVTTINLVLDSIDRMVPYGVIINKCSEKLMNNISGNVDKAREKIVTAINSGKHKTESIYCFEYLKEINDKKNALITLPKEMIEFLNCVPTVCIFPEEVREIELDSFEKLQNEIRSQIDIVINDSKEREFQLKESINFLNNERENAVQRQNQQLEKYKQKKEEMKRQLKAQQQIFEEKMENQQKDFQEKIQKADEQQRLILEQERIQFMQQLEKQKQESRSKRNRARFF
eukprot:TRINITY_DN7650_c0_g2_i1.p1 TRINITY_DN7650_c0_g2~~TRINITY_DN7650_c0_g2_i1.p1  ORF type:complete len:335 (-),score=106.93 TRINITY_DN7650_c0_g2_i1:359-1243(-)